MAPSSSARDRFLDLLRASLGATEVVKLTLGKPRGRDPTLRNVYVRPVTLKAGPRLSFVWRHATRDITKNLTAEEALAEVERLLAEDFLDAHLLTSRQTAQFEGSPDGVGRLSVKAVAATPAAPTAAAHDRPRQHPIPPGAAWLRALGVTNERGQAREGMAPKLRQIQKFTELVAHLLHETGLGGERPLTLMDMGCGKGYLTFALAAHLGPHARIIGVETRPELVTLCNQVAHAEGFSHLSFLAGDIATTPVKDLDVLVALHACDTATDDALAKGIAAGASLLVVSPCCHKELRPQLTAPPVLTDALRHGIFQERQSEFVTDAMRAGLLEWAGYRTKVLEFISTEHTAKNLMIAAIRSHPPGDADRAAALRALAAAYGIRHQRLASHLGFALSP